MKKKKRKKPEGKKESPDCTCDKGLTTTFIKHNKRLLLNRQI